MTNADEEALQQALSLTRRTGLILRDPTPLDGGATAQCWTAAITSTQRVVLKIQAGVDDFPTVAENMETLRALAPDLLPLPRLLDYGLLPDYGWYTVAHVLPGKRAPSLTPARLESVLSLNRRQTHQRPARGVDWPARLRDALDPDGRAWTRLAASGSHGQALRDLVFARPPGPWELETRDLVLGDLNLRNVLFDENGGDAVSGLVDVETTLGFGCRSVDLAPLLVDWHRADIRARVDPAAPLPCPAVAELLRREIESIGGRALLTCVVTHRLAEGANWALDHGLVWQMPYWCAAAQDVLRPEGDRTSQPSPGGATTRSGHTLAGPAARSTVWPDACRW
ncbi:phosphotransferase [Promicromonospora sp. NPDC057138]|uniref:phosphotransferase n=1 Tax=Promicromonospora sp. NPDC057138 TaxID=3346031 RepID=UPI003626F6F4